MHSIENTHADTLRRIVVAEDDETNREMLRHYLTKKGFDVVAVGDGRAVLDVIESMHVDLVLLDWMMPELSGIEALRVLRRQSDVPVIMLTSIASSHDVVQALEVGADDYVTKPYDLSVLVARIDARMRARSSAADAAFTRRYELCEKVGEGSFGVVYRARHKELQTDVAVKILRMSASAEPGAIEELRMEGERACRVQHDNAVRIFDFGVLADGRPYLAMELLRGPTLAQEVNLRGPMSLSRAVEVLLRVCDCLCVAHEQRLVHRDIKLANIVLHQAAHGEVVKVLDFGIAKVLDDGGATTRDGIAGSPSYMAPERLCGMRYDGRADVYSLGVCLYEVLTGLAPFRSPTGDAMSIGLMHLRKRAVPPSRIVPLPPAVDDVVAQLLAKDPAHRPNATQAAALLRTLC